MRSSGVALNLPDITGHLSNVAVPDRFVQAPDCDKFDQSVIVFQIFESKDSSSTYVGSSNNSSSNPDLKFKRPRDLQQGKSEDKDDSPVVMKSHKVDQYVRCFGLINEIEFDGEQIEEYLSTTCGVDFLEDDFEIKGLKRVFSKNKMAEINGLFDWFNLLKSGFLPASSGYKNEEDEIKRFFSIRSYIEILNPNNTTTPLFDENCLSFSSLVKIIYLSFHLQTKDGLKPYQTVLKMIGEAFYHHLTTDNILENIKETFQMADVECVDRCQPYFDRMNLSERLRWVLYFSITSYFPPDPIQTISITDESGNWFSAMPPALRFLLAKIHMALTDESNVLH